MNTKNLPENLDIETLDKLIFMLKEVDSTMLL